MSWNKYITPVSSYFPIHPPRATLCPPSVTLRAWLWKPPASKHHRMSSIAGVRGVPVCREWIYLTYGAQHSALFMAEWASMLKDLWLSLRSLFLSSQISRSISSLFLFFFPLSLSFSFFLSMVHKTSFAPFNFFSSCYFSSYVLQKPVFPFLVFGEIWPKELRDQFLWNNHFVPLGMLFCKDKVFTVGGDQLMGLTVFRVNQCSLCTCEGG